MLAVRQPVLRFWMGCALLLGTQVACAESTPTPMQCEWTRSADLWRESRGGQYVPPSVMALKDVGQLAQTFLLQGQHDPALAQQAADAGWKLETLCSAGRVYRVLREAADQRQGRGLYLVMADQPEIAVQNIMLQVPHRFSDRYTGTLAARWLTVESPKILALATVPRAQKVDGRIIDADLAHLERSVMRHLSAIFLEGLPDLYVVQLHGFDAAKRKTQAGIQADVILSAGHDRGSPRLDRLSACLGGAQLGRVKRYPAEVRELGGTTNTIGQLVHAFDSQGFVHAELSASLRTRLREEAKAMSRFAACF